MTSSELILTSRKASELLGVHESSIKRWCNDGELDVFVTSGGHRRIRWEDLMVFAEKKNLSHAYLVFGSLGASVYALKEAYLKKPHMASLEGLLAEWTTLGRLEVLGQLLYFLITELKLTFEELCDGIIFPYLKNLGELWSAGKIDVTVEHRHSQEWIQALYLLRYRLGFGGMIKPQFSKMAVLACSENNTHEMALHCIRIILERLGYEVIFLGARVPSRELKSCADRVQAQLVCVSFSACDSLEVVEETYQLFKPSNGLSESRALAFGGPIFQTYKIKETSPPSRFGQFTTMGEFSVWLKSCST
jgi:MerR family transcriptional regulator, light-induced transcriptional regulator